MMGCEHIVNLEAGQGAEVVALADPDADNLAFAEAAAVSESDRVATYADHRGLLARDDLDAVVIASPNHTHVDVLADVLATNLHVMVEKPMCTSVEECRGVGELLDDRSGLFWVGLEYRYMPTIAAFVEQARSPDVGAIRMMSIREHRFPFFKKVDNWNRFSANTGGTLVEKCCHFFDLMNLVMRSRPERVYASGGQDVNHLDERYERPDGTQAAADILDNAYVVIDFAGGERAMLDLCMFAEGGRHEQELIVVGDRAEIETTVPGDTVWVGPRDGRPAASIACALSPTVGHEGFHHGASFREHQEFQATIRSGGSASVGFQEGLWSVAVGEAAHRSIDLGRPVLLEELGLP
jgi:myo-inositol 2-dehydrogenase/D-chiro-inositol 1-dehydrogenase